LNFEDGPPPYFPPDVASSNPTAPKLEPKTQAPIASLPSQPGDTFDLPELPGNFIFISEINFSDP